MACIHMSSSTDPHRAHHYCYCDLYLMSVLTSHKQIKNNLILARHSLQNMLAVILPEERESKKNKHPPADHTCVGVNPRTITPSSSCLWSMPSFFTAPSNGIPSSVSCCLCRSLGNRGSWPVGRDFFFFF